MFFLHVATGATTGKANKHNFNFQNSGVATIVY